LVSYNFYLASLFHSSFASRIRIRIRSDYLKGFFKRKIEYFF